jgi:Xaa-Pro aminopeptidase
VLLNGERMTEHIGRCGLDALVLALPVSVSYATEHESSFESAFRNYMLFPGGSAGRYFRSFAVIAAGGERALVAHAAIAVTSYSGWTEALEVYGGEGFDIAIAEQVPATMRLLARQLAGATARRDPMEAIAAAVSAVAPQARRIGVEYDGLEPADFATLRQALSNGIELADASVLVRLIRMVKTSDQLERLARAAETAELGLHALVEAAEVGIDALALADIFRSEVATRGADFGHVAIDPRGFGIAMGRHVLEQEDVMMLDVGCRFRGCVSDTGVTLALSPPSPLVSEEYAALFASIEAGAEKLGPGERVVDVYGAMRDVVDGTIAAASRPQGHGLGQESKEIPFIGPLDGERFADDCIDIDANIALEAGMVINLEIPLDVPGSRSFQIEQTFIITAAGAEPITTQNREQIVTAATASPRTIPS